MTDRLAQILESERLVGADALDEALRRQVVYEGSLDTNLLELDAIQESDVLRGLGEAYQLPMGEKSDIDTVEAHIPRIFPLQFAEAYRMVPFRLVGPNLSVLVNSEPDPQLFAKIRERLQLHVNATVTTEARLHYAMHRLYATRLLPRFESLLTKLDGEAPRSLHEPPPGEHFLSWGLPSGRVEGKPRGNTGRSAPDIAALLARLDTAPNRDAVIEILLEIAVGVFDFVCMFVVQGNDINGWRGVDPDQTARIAKISIPVASPSVFQTIYTTHGHYLGPLPDNPYNQDFLDQLGREAPRTALLAPILVRGKLVAVVYADNGGRPVPSRRVSGLLLLAHRVGMCLETLIRRRKRLAAQPALEPAVAESDAPTVKVPSATVPGPPEDEEAPAPLPIQEPQLLGDSEYEIIEEAAESDGWDDVSVGWNDALSTVPDESEEDDDSYVAFADVGDSPEESLADWEDVLVDAASASMEPDSTAAAASRSHSMPPAVTWEDVIAEANAAPHLSKAREQQIEVAGTQVDPLELLFDSLSAKDASTRTGAVERLLAEGSSIDAQLQARFPGVLDLDPFDSGAQLTSFEACGGMCALLARRGDSVATLVARFLESPHRQQRLIATYFFLAVRYPKAIDAVARRLYDVEPRIRYLAADTLRAYAGDPTYARVMQSLREQLKVPVLETQVTTVQVLGQLRDPRAVPSLIPMVVSPQETLRAATTSALAMICAQAFDQNVTAWADWWRANYMKPREAWLVMSLRHPNLAIQRIAFVELQLMTGYTGSFDAGGSAEEKEPVIRVWEAWLRELEHARRAQTGAQPQA